MIEITDAGYIIAAISMGLATMSSLVRRAVLDQEKLKENKEKLKEHQATLKEASKKGDTKRMQKAQEQMMELSMEQMKQSFKPLMFTFIPFILVFGWLRDQYSQIGDVATIFGFGLGWFWWYFVCAMLVSIVINKIMEKI